MDLIINDGSPKRSLSNDEKSAALADALAQIGGDPKRVLLVPPDHTRLNSDAGTLTAMLYAQLAPSATVDIMPALGTHTAMTEAQLRMMFGPDIPLDCFIPHDWRNGLIRLGELPGEFLEEVSGGRVDYPVFVEINRLLFEGNYDLILSIGQVVPHEVIGMANYTKNVCIGVGGGDTIHKSHFLGAVVGMENIMGRSDTAVRRVLNRAYDDYVRHLPVHFILTVMEQDLETREMHMRGLFIGDGDATFEAAAKLSQQVNLNLLPTPLPKVVAYLDPHEFKSTWLGNKAVYRTRMVIADDGDLMVLAPGLVEFGEDPTIDRLIRKHGYRTTPEILAAVESDSELRENLSAAAHLIHGSSEERFTITYCPGPGVSHEEIRAVGYEAGDLDAMLARYNPETLRDGFNTLPDGEEIYFISNPALGLWALASDFAD
ncbi:MAG: nickel-dependent lactate racemase [Rhodothermales bacterium]|jgi:nickel-dependent lactate racemase